MEPRSPALQADSLPSEPQGKPKITGEGSLSLLQGIFPTQELNRGLLHCRQILYQLSYQGSPNYNCTNIICFNSMWTVKFQMFKLDLEKAEEPEIKLPTSVGSSKKQESSRKTSISALLTMPKPLTVWITINCRKFWKRRKYQTTWPASSEISMQVGKQQLELDVEQQTGSK